MRKLAAEERRTSQRRNRRDTTDTSISAMSTINTRHGRSASMTTEEDSVLRSENLSKQGGRVKSWHRRFFILHRTGGLKYYRDEEAYELNPGDPLGRILYTDMMDFQEMNTVAQSMPSTVYSMMGMRYIFAVHTDSRTFVIATPSKSSQMAWIKTINSAWYNFQMQYHRKNQILGNIWKVGVSEVIDLARDLTQGASDPDEVLDQMEETICETFSDQVEQCFNQRLRAMIFYRWKAVYLYNRSRSPEHALDITPAERHRSFWINPQFTTFGRR